MSEDHAQSSILPTAALAVIVVVVIVFLPLGLAGAEAVLFKTQHVEEFCRTIGIHDALSRIYEPIFARLHP